MARVCWLCGSSHLSVWDKTVPQLLPWCQKLCFLPVCHWCLSRCYPSAGAQREWIWVSSYVGSLRGTAWDSSSFFHWLIQSPLVLQPEVIGTYLPHTGMLNWGIWYGVRTPHSWDIPLKFLSTTRVCGTSPFHTSTPPTSLDGCGFFNSILVRLHSGWFLSNGCFIILS